MKGSSLTLDQNHTPTEDDIQTLVDKPVQFDETLNPAQRSIFRARILATVPGETEVEGHNWEMRWEARPAAMYRQWIWVDDGRGSPAPDGKSG